MRLRIVEVVGIAGVVWFGAGMLFADVLVRGHVRRNGTLVAPHFRSDANANFWDNYSTFGNVNPYTGTPGTKIRPSRSGIYAPSTWPVDGGLTAFYPAWNSPTYFRAQDVDGAELATALELARREAELEAKRERIRNVRTQARRAVEAKIYADSRARRSQWQQAEARKESEERARLNAMIADRWKEWLAREAHAKREAAARLQQEMTDYSRQWDEANLLLEARQRSGRLDATRRVAESHTIVKALDAGDGQQTRRDAQRRRDDAWANAMRDVKEKQLVKYQRGSRAAAERNYQVAANARLSAAERERLAAWTEQQTEFRLAAEHTMKREASERIATFERHEGAIVASAKADAEYALLHIEEPVPSASDGSNPVGNQPSTLPVALPTGLLLTVLTVAGAMIRMRT